MEKFSKTAQISEIQWKQVWSLLLLDAAIIISWIAYHKYQPELLKQFQFAEFSFQLAIVQGIILLLTPPVAGYFADNIRKKRGERLPVVNIGISFVSMVFMVVAITIFSNPTGIVRMLFPVMIVLWLISMNIFHSPAISTVELFVPPQKLPQVMAIFAVVADIAQSIEPSINDIIDFFGPVLTFMAGGLLVFTTGYFFQKATKNLVANQEISAEHDVFKQEETDFLTVALLGIGMGVAVAYFFNLLPNIAERNIAFIDPKGFKGSYFASILLIVAALLSYPLGKVIKMEAIQKWTWTSFGVALFLISGSFFTTDWVSFILMCIFPICFAMMSVSFLPMAFMQIEAKHKVLGIGIFFSGVELCNSLIDIAQAGKWL